MHQPLVFEAIENKSAYKWALIVICVFYLAQMIVLLFLAIKIKNNTQVIGFYNAAPNL